MSASRDLLCALCGFPRSKHMGRLEVCPVEARFRLRRSDQCGATNGRRGRCRNIVTHECTTHQVVRGQVRDALLRRCQDHLTGESPRPLTAEVSRV